VPHACSIHADVTRQIVPAAAAVAVALHAFVARSCLRAAVARRFTAAMRVMLSLVTCDRGPGIRRSVLCEMSRGV
jgi:hypothetical protein